MGLEVWDLKHPQPEVPTQDPSDLAGMDCIWTDPGASPKTMAELVLYSLPHTPTAAFGCTLLRWGIFTSFFSFGSGKR